MYLSKWPLTFRREQAAPLYELRWLLVLLALVMMPTYSVLAMQAEVVEAETAEAETADTETAEEEDSEADSSDENQDSKSEGEDKQADAKEGSSKEESDSDQVSDKQEAYSKQAEEKQSDDKKPKEETAKEEAAKQEDQKAKEESSDDPEEEQNAEVESEPTMEVEPEQQPEPKKEPEETKDPPVKSDRPKGIIGSTATLLEKQSGLKFRARIDTGAKSCSLHVERVEIQDESTKEDIVERMTENIGKVITFVVKNGDGKTHILKRKIASYVVIKTSDKAEGKRRYKVPLTFLWKNMEKEVLVTLNDRAHMDYPLLIGRNFLRGDFLVDVELNSDD